MVFGFYFINFSNGVPAVIAVKMVLARGIDVLVHQKFQADDGLFADLRYKQKMPVRTDLRLIAVDFVQAEAFKSKEMDILCLVQGINRLYTSKDLPAPFLISRTLQGKNLYFCFL